MQLYILPQSPFLIRFAKLFYIAQMLRSSRINDNIIASSFTLFLFISLVLLVLYVILKSFLESN